MPLPAASKRAFASEILAQVLNFIVSFAVIALLFAMIFKFLPDVKVRWRRVWIGATGTALLFALGKHLLGWYLGRESTASAYGAAGSVVVIVLWVYYASLILLLGAEFTQVFARKTGTRIETTEYAEPVSAQERTQQGMAPS
jgi:membrane protein